MHDHRIEIMTRGGIDPPTLEGVNANDAVTIANKSGTGATVTYPIGTNPFSDVLGDTSETLPNGGETKHTIFAEFNPSATYNLVVALEDDPRETSPRIRITGGGTR